MKLMTAKVSGGILPDFETEEFKRWWKETDDREEQARKREAEAEQYASECQDIYDKLEAMFLPHLREDAAAVNATARIKPADEKIFEQFKEFCATAWSPPLPALPAHPAAVAAFLTSELIRGTSHFMKRLSAISRVHQAVGLPDPTSDVLCKALVRKIKQTSKTSNQKDN
jgi:hypothetical protein